MVEVSEEKAKNQPLFRDLKADDKDQEVIEMESLCVHCEETGTTRMLLTKIPYFKEIVIMAFECPHCNARDSSIQPCSEIQEKGVRFKLNVKGKATMNRQIVRQESASFKIEELNFEAPPFTSKGVLTTIEGLLNNAVEGLNQHQVVRRITEPELAAKIDDIIGKLNEYRSGENPFTLLVEDVSGNSFIENPHAPHRDPELSVEFFERSKEQNESLGLYDQNKIPDNEEENDEPENIKDEVLEFLSNCPGCQTPITTKMKIINIPHFKEVIIMATNCDSCGYKSNDVKASGAIEEKGKKLTFRMTDKTDLTRDILISETCALAVPDLDIELHHSSLGGKFTTVEGLFSMLEEHLGRINPFAVGDSASKGNIMKDILKQISQIKSGELFVTIILDDPVGNSFIQNLYAPDQDPELNIEYYERTEEQNSDLGLLDMKTESYD